MRRWRWLLSTRGFPPVLLPRRSSSVRGARSAIAPLLGTSLVFRQDRRAALRRPTPSTTRAVVPRTVVPALVGVPFHLEVAVLRAEVALRRQHHLHVGFFLGERHGDPMRACASQMRVRTTVDHVAAHRRWSHEARWASSHRKRRS